MSKRLKIGVLIVIVALIAAFAGGCVFGGGLTAYNVTYVLCDNAETPAYYAEGASNPETYTTAARNIDLASPIRDGYVFRGWYDNPNYTGVGRSSIAPGTYGDLTLYARWEVMRPTGTNGDYTDEAVATWRGFLPYVEEFDTAYSLGQSGNVVVTSREELTAYCEYVQYKYINFATAPSVTIDYEYDSRSLPSEIRSVSDTLYFGSYIGLTWSSTVSDTVKIGIKYPEYVDGEGSITCAATDYFTQIAPYNYSENGAPHAFAIDSIDAALSCATSNQLFYAAMTGARPVPDAGSVAEEIYGKARAALAEIVNDGMEDYEKVRAIYDWLIMTVTYDEDVILDNIALPAAISYDAFYLEGVFGSGRAVCDGISKAMTLLCRIEGIPCVRVVGSDHAWNKVYVGGHWYIADATFGDTGTQVNGKYYSFLTHRSFLVPESMNERYIAANNYTDDAYAATKDFGFYKYEIVNNANLVIESREEFRELYKWAESLNYRYAYSIDFYVTDKSFVTMGRYAFDDDPKYCTLFFNL